jgi:hypothetical protein
MPLRPKVQFLAMRGCERKHDVSPLGRSRKTDGVEAQKGDERGERMDWRPKGGNTPTDHDLEIAIFEAP